MPNELVRRAVEYLHDHGSATSDELASFVFGGERLAPLLGTLQDERLTFDGACWRLREPSKETAILELRASGPNPKRHRLVELAAQSQGRRFQVHIGAGEDDRLPLPEAAAALREFLGGATVVGFGYVPAYLEQLLGPSWPAIDLLRLLYELTEYSGRPDPKRLARHFALPQPLSHRPLDLLPFSCALFEQLRGDLSLDELLRTGQPQTPAPPQPPVLPAGQPGVYVMSNWAGEPLYVGKSRVLTRGGSGYRRTPIAGSPGLKPLMQLTAGIEVIPAASELEALLLESQLIEQWLPDFNVQRRSGRRPRYLRLSNEAFPRLTVCTAALADGATYFGPLRHATAAARLRELLAAVLRLRTCSRDLPSRRKPAPACLKAAAGQCLAPCLPGPPPSPYSREVELARQLLSAQPAEFQRLLLKLLRERPPSPTNAAKLKRRLQALRTATVSC